LGIEEKGPGHPKNRPGCPISCQIPAQTGYEVYAIIRRSSYEKLDRLAQVSDRIEFVQGEFLDRNSLHNAISLTKPDEAMSFVLTSGNQLVLTGEFTGLGLTRFLEAIHQLKPDTRF